MQLMHWRCRSFIRLADFARRWRIGSWNGFWIADGGLKGGVEMTGELREKSDHVMMLREELRLMRKPQAGKALFREMVDGQKQLPFAFANRLELRAEVMEQGTR